MKCEVCSVREAVFGGTICLDCFIPRYEEAARKHDEKVKREIEDAIYSNLIFGSADQTTGEP